MLKKLVQEVIDWGKAKGIHDKLSANSQLVLAIGELCNEFPDAISKGKPPEEIKKELGDVLVFYINYLVMGKQETALQITSRIEGFTIFRDGLYDGFTCNYEIILHGLNTSKDGCRPWFFVAMLAALASRIDSSLEECLRLAHEKNTKRKHVMKEGKLVKKEDL